MVLLHLPLTAGGVPASGETRRGNHLGTTSCAPMPSYVDADGNSVPAPDAEDLTDAVDEMRDDVNEELVTTYIPPRSYAEEWDTETLEKELYRVYGLEMPVSEWAEEEGIADEEILERVTKLTDEHMKAKRDSYEEAVFSVAQKRVLLQTLDHLWKDHLLALDHLRQGIGLRAYGQRDPLNEYKSEAFSLFEQMLHQLRELVTQRLSRIEIRVEDPEEIMQMRQQQRMQESRMDPALQGQLPEGMQQRAELAANAGMPVQSRLQSGPVDPNNPETWGRVGRNQLCPCGSGKKFKHCHGKLA